MEAEPAASWESFLVSFAVRMRGHPCYPRKEAL